MLVSLATSVLPLDDRVVVLPGHGPQTTIGAERATNPYLIDLPDAVSARAGEHRGL
jgi:glyoxylase-like metal-dependent hydrolase (beta-lactamase superfamily II)